jgi:hypothetical protein
VLEPPRACIFLSFAGRFSHRPFIVRERSFCSRENIRS